MTTDSHYNCSVTHKLLPDDEVYMDESDNNLKCHCHKTTVEVPKIRLTNRQMAILVQNSLVQYNQFEKIELSEGSAKKGEVFVDTYSGQKFKIVATEVKV